MISYSLTEIIIRHSYYTVILLFLTILITIVLMKYQVKSETKQQEHQLRREWEEIG
ncbi:hypothetical protein [Gracilibacillus sp. JCM 18860]|uniref:hypothetical protein n=1 Tax=Gracilibacillus sp. JCM 18860 TaxID=1306159 RepID=UPI000A6F6B47